MIDNRGPEVWQQPMVIDIAALVALHNLSPGPVVLLVERSDQVVARVETTVGPVVVKASLKGETIATEIQTNRRFAALGFPVATLLAHGQDPAPYLITTWIAGEALSAGSPPDTLREVGVLLRKIHRLGGGPPYAGNATWEAWMEGWLHHALPWWQRQGKASEADVASAWRGFEKRRVLLARRGFDFILFDGRPEHFLVRQGKLAGLIDLGEARAGDAMMDLAVLGVLEPRLLPGILAGYAPTPEEDEVIQQLLPFYLFLRRLAAAEWNLMVGTPSIAQQAFALLNQFPFS